jgi:uncharacterized protein (TIGR03545 family)
MTETTTAEKKTKKKKGGPIRYEAIVPILVLSLLTFAYFSFYFDRHLKSAIEYVGTQANGAEVNVNNLQTSFLGGKFNLNGLEITNKDRPTHNSLEIGNIHFQFLWDALLRMKFVVEDASINNVQIQKPRKTPGRVLPPEPAKPSKLNALQNEVMAQIQNRYGNNMLGDALALLEGGDIQAQLQNIRGTLQSEARIEAMTKEVKAKQEFWNNKITQLSDTSKIKEIENTIASVQQEKNIAKQAAALKTLNALLKDVDNQYKQIDAAQNQLKAEVNNITQLPNEIQRLVNEDIAALKSRFSIPQLDFKDMAMDMFAPKFAGYIADGRKYQAMAQEYIPEKKDKGEPIVPRKRAEGKNYEFPITTGYPLFWLKRAAISSQGTLDSYSGNVSGELTHVTTSPKVIKKPMVLDVKGDFPAVKVAGVRALVTVDHTKEIGEQTALLQVNSFAVPEQLFFNDEKMKFGFQNAEGTTTLSAKFVQESIDVNWTSALSKPQFVLEHQSKLARELMNSILNNIPVININGSATGTFKNMKMNISSNLGQEIANGLSREIGAKVAEAQDKIRSLVDERINKPKDQLLGQINMIKQNTNSLKDVQQLWKQHEKDIKAQIANLQKGGGGDVKEQGKKLLKGFKI